MLQAVRPVVATLVVGLFAVGCGVTGTQTETAAGSLGTGGTTAGCAAAAEAYLASNQMVDFAEAVRRCPTIADLASALDGRDLTNTAASLMLVCTAGLSVVPGSPIDETIVATSLCRQFREQCVNVEAVQAAYRSGQGLALDQPDDLDGRLQASGDKLAVCERGFFGTEPADEQPAAVSPEAPDATAEEAFRTVANAICDEMQQAMDSAWDALGPEPTDEQYWDYHHGPFVAETQRAAERIGALTIPTSIAAEVNELLEFAYYESLHYENAPRDAIDDPDPYAGFNAKAIELGLNRCAE